MTPLHKGWLGLQALLMLAILFSETMAYRGWQQKKIEAWQPIRQQQQALTELQMHAQEIQQEIAALAEFKNTCGAACLITPPFIRYGQILYLLQSDAATIRETQHSGTRPLQSDIQLSASDQQLKKILHQINDNIHWVKIEKIQKEHDQIHLSFLIE